MSKLVGIVNCGEMEISVSANTLRNERFQSV